MFTTSCFIQKCTPILIEKLVELGYKIVGKTTLSYGIFCNNGKIKICSTNEQPSIKNKNFIQCYDNEELFLALAALRDDTDKDQWFTDGSDWAIWREDGSFRGKPITGFEFHYLPSNTNYNKYHKATAEEIVEHFTMKGGAE